MKKLLPKLIPVLLVLLYLNAFAVTRYVDLNSPSPTPPYTSWPTAATNIQDAIDAAVDGDLVLVTNGVYQTGGRRFGAGLLTNRVAVAKAIRVQSMNGALETVIAGYWVPGSTNGDSAIRCAYLAAGANLVGFTLSNGATRAILSSSDSVGGGVWCESTNAILNNCILKGNASFDFGGGANSGTLSNCWLINNTVIYYTASGFRGGGGGAMNANLNNCVIIGNSAGYGGGSCDSILTGCLVSNNAAFLSGGGAFGSVPAKSGISNSKIIGNVAANYGGGLSGGSARNSLIVSNTAGSGGGGTTAGSVVNNCVIVGNSAQFSGGAYISTLHNCIAYFNTASSEANYGNGSSGTVNNSCTTPLPTGTGNFTNEPLFLNLPGGNFRLDSNSSCINAGNNVYVADTADLDGNPRIVGGVVDVGAYEFQFPTSALSYAWAQQFGLPTDGSADMADPDGDGVNSYGEWRADTIPTNSLSVLRMVNATNSPTGAKVTWKSVSTRNYWLERATNLGAVSPFQPIATNIVGVFGTKTFTDTSATNGGPYFYRVGVQ